MLRLLLVALLFEAYDCIGLHQNNRRRYPTKRVLSSSNDEMTMANVTCHFYEQPLDHFSSESLAGKFKQRYCLYRGYEEKSQGSRNPIFFYTGNESPLEEYVNHTGLMWELAPKHSALVVFAEHRYEGMSVPDLSVWNDPNRREFDGCFTYLTSAQALADFASLLSFINPDLSRPVIAFGGSYGGMLSAWMRIKYPGTIAGAIAASAPIWGLPLTQESRDGRRKEDASGIGGAHRVVGTGVSLPYPPGSSGERTKNNCFENLLATWPLVSYIGSTAPGREYLSDIFRLCSPLKSTGDVTVLLDWAQSPWFDLAEGDFPFPSSYIPFALNMGKNDLPPWPVQKACHDSGLMEDLGVSFQLPSSDDVQPVRYTVHYGDDPSSSLILDIDWDDLTVLREGDNAAVQKLLNATREAVSVWFNVSGNEACFDAIPAINTQRGGKPADSSRAAENGAALSERPRSQTLARELRGTNGEKRNTHPKSEEMKSTGSPPTPAELCAGKIQNETVWTSLVCNEDMNLITTLARGLGDDFFWPPSHPKGTQTYSDIVSSSDDPNGMAELCADSVGAYGYPPAASSDPWSTWLDDYYGGSRLNSHSNIVFSNGLLDPWAAAGVYAPGMNPTSPSSKYVDKGVYNGPMVQNITADGSVVAVIIQLGAHHLDLMYSTAHDPHCVIDARRVEDEHITRWIREWQQQYHGSVPWS